MIDCHELIKAFPRLAALQNATPTLAHDLRRFCALALEHMATEVKTDCPTALEAAIVLRWLREKSAELRR